MLGSKVVYDDGFMRVEIRTDKQGNMRTVSYVTDSVSGLIYIEDTGEVILVRQERTSQHGREGCEDGFVDELVAGRFDVELGPIALFCKESKEEADVDVRFDQVQVLNHGGNMVVSAGACTERTTLCYARVRSSQVGPDRDTFGAEDEGEHIGRIRMDRFDFWAMQFDCVRVFALAYHLLIDQMGRQDMRQEDFLRIYISLTQ